MRKIGGRVNSDEKEVDSKTQGGRNRTFLFVYNREDHDRTFE